MHVQEIINDTQLTLHLITKYIMNTVRHLQGCCGEDFDVRLTGIAGTILKKIFNDMCNLTVAGIFPAAGAGRFETSL